MLDDLQDIHDIQSMQKGDEQGPSGFLFNANAEQSQI